MPPKTTIATTLLKRTVRPSPDMPWCWPWAYRFEPSMAERAAGKVELERSTRFKRTVLDERAKVVAVRADKDGVKLTLESAAGELGECFATNIAVVPKGKPRTFTHIETHAILAGMEEANAYFQDGPARTIRDLVGLKEAASAGMTIDASVRRAIIAKLLAMQHSYSLTHETDHGKITAALAILRDGGQP